MKLIAALAFFAIATSASAVTIDFEVLQHNDSIVANHGATYSEDGYTLTATRPDGTSSLFISRGMQDTFFTGSTALLNFFPGGVTTMTKDNGIPFSILSIDLAEYDNSPGVPVTFVGTRSGGGSVTQSFLLDNVFASAETFFFSGLFTNLTSLSWTQAPNFHTFDNLVVNEVPVPAAVWLFGTALFGLIGFGKRRKTG